MSLKEHENKRQSCYGLLNFIFEETKTGGGKRPLNSI